MNGILPNWLEQWLGVEAASPGEGTVWSLENTWGWAPWVTLLLAMFAVAWVVVFLCPRSAPRPAAWPRRLLVTHAAGADRDRAVHDRRVHAVAAAHRLADRGRRGRRFGQHGHSTTATTTRSCTRWSIAAFKRPGSSSPRGSIWPRPCCWTRAPNLLADDRAPLPAEGVLRFQRRAAQSGTLAELRERSAPVAAARREQPAGRRLAARAGRSARHAAGRDHFSDRWHQHRRRVAGRRGPLCPPQRRAAVHRRPGQRRAGARSGADRPAGRRSRVCRRRREFRVQADRLRALPARRSTWCCAKRTIRPCWRR